MSTTIELATSRLRRRMRTAALVEALGPQLTLGLCVAATVFLVARHVLGWDVGRAAWSFAPLALLPVTVWRRARARVPSAASAVAWLDLWSGGSGRIVTVAEVGEDGGGAGPWNGAAERTLERSPPLPRVGLRRHLVPVLCALAFALGATRIEPREAVVGPPTAVAAAAVERLTERLEALEEAVVLDPEVERELEEAVDRLRTELDQAQPESTFEAIDALASRLDRLAEEALDVADRARTELAAAGTQADPGAALAELVDELQSAGLLHPDDVVSEELGDFLAAGPAFDPGELRGLEAGERMQLSDELSRLLAERAGELAQLAKPGQGRLTEVEVAEHECGEECEKPGGT